MREKYQYWEISKVMENIIANIQLNEAYAKAEKKIILDMKSRAEYLKNRQNKANKKLIEEAKFQMQCKLHMYG